MPNSTMGARMAKRFTDNEKWKKRLFKGLSTVDKLFFLYILDECDHAGIWHIEVDIAEIRIGEEIDIENFKKQMGKHLIEFDNGEKWFIPTFVEFQYGELNPSVNAHKSVINKLTKQKLLKLLKNSSGGVKDKDKDKDKDMDKDKALFDEARKLYPGIKKGCETEFNNFKLKHKGHKAILPLLESTIKKQIEWRANSSGFIPEWKNFQTWINQRCWEDETPATKTDDIYTDFDTIQFCKKHDIEVSYKGDRLTGLTAAFSSIFERIEDNKWRKK